jgi:hypothetical protein
MAGLTHTIPELDRKGLREFGLVTGGILAGLFGLFFPWLLEFSIPVWPWIAGGALALWALAAPMSLRPVYFWWMRLALLLSRITTPIILGIVFYLVFLPVALVMKLIGRDTMARRFDAGTTSYRVASNKAPRDQMEKPF